MKVEVRGEIEVCEVEEGARIEILEQGSNDKAQSRCGNSAEGKISRIFLAKSRARSILEFASKIGST